MAPRGSAAGVLASAGIALVTFLATDAAVFRTGLYDLLVAYDSSVGTAARIVRAARPDANPTVAVVGDSRAAEAFSVAEFDRAMRDGSLRGLNLAMPGSTLRVWCHLLERVDPHRDRFRFVVVPLGTYGGRGFERGDPARRLDDLSFLGPIQSLGQVPALADSFPDARGQRHAWLTGLVKAYAYRHDVRDLLANPLPRARGRWRLFQAHDSAVKYEGRKDAMTGVRIDGDRIVGYREVIPEARRERLADFVFGAASGPEVDGWVAARDRYWERWLGRICDRYARTGTQVVIMQIPATVLSQRASAPDAALSPALQRIVEPAHVHLVPAEVTADLRTPEKFCDTTHLNHVGRQQWTTRLAAFLRRLL